MNLTELLGVDLSQLEARYHEKIAQINPNVREWPLMSSPLPTLLFSSTYLIVVSLLCLFMKCINAFHLKFFIFCYNIFSILLNIYISFKIVYLKYKAGDYTLCTTINATGDLYSLEMNQIIWWFYVSKGIDFLDTVFFVLRKKLYKISFLHIYNHCTMFPLWWFIVAYFANGTAGVAALINSLVHVIMHFYYIMSTIGPSFQKWIWWKRYILRIQMLQFCLLILYCSLFLHKNCDYSNDSMIWFVIFYSLSHVVLIYNFYTKSYYKIMTTKLDEPRRAASTSHQAQTVQSTSLQSPITRRRALRETSN